MKSSAGDIETGSYTAVRNEVEKGGVSSDTTNGKSSLDLSSLRVDSTKLDSASKVVGGEDVDNAFMAHRTMITNKRHSSFHPKRESTRISSINLHEHEGIDELLHVFDLHAPAQKYVP